MQAAASQMVTVSYIRFVALAVPSPKLSLLGNKPKKKKGLRLLSQGKVHFSSKTFFTQNQAFFTSRSILSCLLVAYSQSLVRLV